MGTTRLTHQGSYRRTENSHDAQLSSRIAPLLFSLVALVAALYPANAYAQSITVVQRATASQQPSSSGAVTIALPKTTGAGHTLVVGVSFWPLDISSVADSSGDSFARGLTTSIYHSVSQGVLYSNFYYAKSTAGGATSITLHFTGSSIYVVAAIAEVSGLDPASPLDTSAYHESLSSTSPWSSAALTTSAANEYLFAWAADEWNNPSCSNPTSGWSNTVSTSGGATLCLLDRSTSATGSYQVSVTPAYAFNYAMEIVGFKAAFTTSTPTPPTAPLTISSTTLPAGTVGTAYSATLAATGGVAPYTWSSGALPSGLLLSSAGIINGTPTTTGTQMVSLAIKDSAGTITSASLALTISSSGLPSRPATTYSLLHFGNAGYGGDDTNVFQTALNYTAANGAVLEIPAGSYNISPIFFPANSYLVVDANVTVTATSGYGTSAAVVITRWLVRSALCEHQSVRLRTQVPSSSSDFDIFWTQQRWDVPRWPGWAKQESLDLAATFGADAIQLLTGFHPFRRDRHAEALAKTCDRADDGQRTCLL